MFKIKIYLHENIDYDILYGLLKKNGFDVISTAKGGVKNKNNKEYLESAFVFNAVLLTQIEIIPKGRHKGILITKDMMPAQILKALKNLRKQIEENRINLDNKVLPLNIFL